MYVAMYTYMYAYKCICLYVCMHVYVVICIHVSMHCSMGRRDLPNMYARSLRAASLRAEGMHIRQTPTAHVTSDMYHFWHSKNLPKQN